MSSLLNIQSKWLIYLQYIIFKRANLLIANKFAIMLSNVNNNVQVGVQKKLR